MLISIRSAEHKDIERIRRILTDTALATFPNDEYGITVEDIKSDLEIVTSEKAVSDQIQFTVEHPHERLFLVALIDSSVVGLIACKKKGDTGTVIGLFVLPEYQGKGVGSSLLKASAEFFNDVSSVFLTYESYNLKAKSFYQKHGFKETGRTFAKHQVKSGAYMPETEMSRAVGIVGNFGSKV